MVKNTLMKRDKYELYLRDMVSEVIDDTSVVKYLVNQVFQEVNMNSIHITRRRKNKKEYSKKDLVYTTRAKILEYLNDNNIYDNYEKILEINVSDLCKKYLLCNEYFGKNEYLVPVDIDANKNLINEELDKLSNIEKEIVIRRYYFLQSYERISNALDISFLKIEYLIRKVVYKIWKNIINNDKIFSKNVNSNMRDIRTLKRNLQEHLNDISKCLNMDKNHISALNIQEYFIIKVLGETTLSEVELTFDDICLEGMSKCKPSKDEKENLKYLFMYRNTLGVELKKKDRRRRAIVINAIATATVFLVAMSGILIFSGSKIPTKASNIDKAYSSRCERLGMNFMYTVDGKDVKVNVEQLYYVKDEMIKDYSYKLDTELAKRIERHNLYADSINDEQTVYEAATFNYLSLENEEKLEYVQGDRKYVYNEVYNILFVIEYKNGAWECIKVIYVKDLGVNSKFHLDSKTILKDFYKESADGDWKCEVQLVASKEGEEDTFSEVTFIKDNTKLNSEGIYRTGNLVYNRTFNASTSTMEMNPVSDLSKNNFGDSFITYIEENDEVIFYYNYYDSSKFVTEEIGKVEKEILEEIAGYIEEYPNTIKEDIKSYGICIPQTNQYILPFITNDSENSDYVSEYREFSYYDTRRLFGTNSEQLKILINNGVKTTLYDKIYKLNDEVYYENVAVLNAYRQEVLKENYTAFTYENNIFIYRVFNNEFVEILKYKGAESNVEIPDYIDGLEVRYIANNAFIHNDSIVEVEIPEQVREIGNYAFAKCKNLQRVVINGKVISYGDGAYEGCKNLKTIEVDSSPMYIGRDCFKDTAMLSKMYKHNGVKYYKNVAISYEDKDEFIEIKEGTRGIADGFIEGKEKYVEEVSIPVSVKYIGEAAFEDAVNLKELELPKGLVYMGAYAFSGCHSLDDVSIPNYITQINEGVFANCLNMYSVKFGSGVKVIRDNAFVGIADVDMIYIPKTVKCVFPNAFDEDVKVVTGAK